MNDLRQRLLALSAALLVAGCTSGSAGPPVPAPIEGETSCADYEAAATHARMHGGLRRPVVLTVLSAKGVIAQQILTGTHEPKDSKATLPLPDADAEYQLDWAQCAKPLGPYPASAAVPVLECDAPVYKTDRLVTKKGDAASRSIKFALPPEPACWLDEGAPPVVPAK